VILEPPLSIGAGGRSPEKTSPGMVDRPSKRQGPGPACGEVDGGVLAWHGGFDRPSVRMRPEDDRAGRSLRPSAGEKVTGPWARHPRPAPPPSQRNPRGKIAGEATGVCAPAAAIPGVAGCAYHGSMTPRTSRTFVLRGGVGSRLRAGGASSTRRGHDAGGADGISTPASSSPRLRHVRHREKGIAPARAHRGDQLGEEPPARPGGARDGGTSALISLAGRRDLRGSMARTKREHTFGETGCKCVDARG